MLADTDGLLRISEHKAEHHLYSKHKGVEIPYDSRLVEQSDAVGRRNAAKGFHALLHQKPLFGKAEMITGLPQNRRFCGKRRCSGMDESCCLQRDEGYAACTDAVTN